MQVLKDSSGWFAPAGFITLHTSHSAIPVGWLLCNGARADAGIFSDLYAVIGDSYGVPNVPGADFVLPDLRDTALRAMDKSGAIDPGGDRPDNDKQGVRTGTPQIPFTATTSSAGAHAHAGATLSDSGTHTHSFTNPVRTTFSGVSSDGKASSDTGQGVPTSTTTNHNHTLAALTQPAHNHGNVALGGGDPATQIDTIKMVYIIKAVN